MKNEKWNIENIKKQASSVVNKGKAFVEEYAKVVKEKGKIAFDKVKEVSVASLSKVKPILMHMKEEGISLFGKVKTKAVAKYESSNVDLSFVKKIHFNFHHFATVSLVALMAFFVTLYSTGYNTATVNAESMMTPKVSSFNKEAVEVNYGDNNAVAEVAKDILKDQVSEVSEPVEISTDGMNSVYALEDYVVTTEVDGTAKLGEMTAKVSVETKETYEMDEMKKIVLTDNESVSNIETGTKYTYNVKLHIKDSEAPKVTFWMDDTTIEDTEDYSAQDYVRSVTDNVDGVITDYAVENEVPQVDGKWEPGRHDVTIRVKDSSGNETVETLIVRVIETSAPGSSEESNSSSNGSSHSRGSVADTVQTASFSGAGGIVSAAYAQLGRYQDCTMLVTNSLAAVGIYYHGWPAGYLSLGSIVPASQAQPGDIIYYADGGMGLAHVAVYVGGGMAVHGGWNGNQTVLYSAYVGSGPVFIRVAG